MPRNGCGHQRCTQSQRMMAGKNKCKCKKKKEKEKEKENGKYLEIFHDGVEFLDSSASKECALLGTILQCDHVVNVNSIVVAHRWGKKIVGKNKKEKKLKI